MLTVLKTRLLPNHQVELAWQAVSGRIYHILRSADLATWVDFAGPYEGEDDTVFVLQIPAQGEHWHFKLVVSVPQGYSVPAYTVTAFSGAYVDLHWENLGPAVYPGARYDVVRDGTTLASQNSTSVRYRDTSVASGKTYKYEVRFFS